MSLSADNALCRRIAYTRGHNFSIGMRTLPRARRAAVIAVYAFCRMADDFADEAGNPEESLTLWERELDRVYAGDPQTPVGRALAEAARRYPIPAESFRRLISGGRRDQVQHRYRTRQELMVYISEVAWTISELTLPIFGYTDPHAPELGRELATALQMTNIVRDVGEDARRGRIYLPIETLIRFGASEKDVLDRRPTEGLLRAIEYEAGVAREHFQRSVPLAGMVEPGARRAVKLFGTVYRRVLAGVLRDPCRSLR